MKRSLYIDFDGVILDTIPPLYKIIKDYNESLYNRMIDHTLSNDDELKIRELMSHVDWNILLKETPQINDSIRHINDIVKSQKYDVAILTHVNSFKEMEAKFAFISSKINSEIDIICVPKRFDKTVATRSCKDCILIDDHSDNIKKWIDAGGIGIKFTSHPEKHPEFKCISSLDQLMNLI
ncbi:MAG: hypothetical protein WC343_11410 [Bacilli bacterium]|jgi:hypothetical protein